MSNLDLNNARDFGRATQGAVSATSAVLSLFGQERADWDIQESSYISNSSAERGRNPVIFHVFQSKVPWSGAVDQIQDSGGRRKVAFMFPYKDGQTTDDLGRSPESFSIQVILHGPNYIQGYKQLFQELQKPEPGRLNHPIRGPIDCVLDDFTIMYKSDSRQAMAINLTFIEHNYTIGDLGALSDDTSVKSAISRALEVFQDISTAITNVRAALIFGATLKARIATALEAYQTAYTSTLAEINKLFNNGGSQDIPALIPVYEGGLLTDTGQTQGTVFTVAQSPNDPYINVPTDSLSPEIASISGSIEIEKKVNDRRSEINAVIAMYKEEPTGLAQLDFYEDIVNLKASGIALQEALEAGQRSSRSTVVNYNIPRQMSLREATYLNGVSMTRLQEVELLNPDLLSVNLIEPGTMIKVPK